MGAARKTPYTENTRVPDQPPQPHSTLRIPPLGYRSENQRKAQNPIKIHNGQIQFGAACFDQIEIGEVRICKSAEKEIQSGASGEKENAGCPSPQSCIGETCAGNAGFKKARAGQT